MKILLKKIIKITLFTYSAILAFALTFGAFSRGFNYSNIITALLFLPITYHFILEIKKGLRNATSIKDESRQETFYFSLKSFISQKDPSFAITIILLTISASITFLRAANVLPTTATTNHPRSTIHNLRSTTTTNYHSPFTIQLLNTKYLILNTS